MNYIIASSPDTSPTGTKSLLSVYFRYCFHYLSFLYTEIDWYFPNSGRNIQVEFDIAKPLPTSIENMTVSYIAKKNIDGAMEISDIFRNN